MYEGKSILAIIPARGGSKGIPRKNIKTLDGKPLIAWSIEAGKKSKYIDRIIVSTEDKEIRDISLVYGAEVPFLRPKELAQDNTSSVDTIVDVIMKLKDIEKLEYDFILLLQPTSPLRNEKHIDESIDLLISNLDKYNALISVTELEHPVYWNRNIDDSQRLRNFMEYDKNKNYRRQDFMKTYRLNGAIYLIKTDAFLNYKNFETKDTLAYIMNRKSSIDIDCIDDLELAEYYMSPK